MLDRRRLLACLTAIAAPGLVHAAQPVKILFVDTGNTGRSLMAETIARDFARRKGLAVAAISRGLDVDPFDEAPEPNAQALMAARGLDVTGHLAQLLTPADIGHADLILTMTTTHADKVRAMAPGAAGKIHTLAGYATGAEETIPDAWGKPMAVYRAVLGQLDRLVPRAMTKATGG